MNTVGHQVHAPQITVELVLHPIDDEPHGLAADWLHFGEEATVSEKVVGYRDQRLEDLLLHGRVSHF